MIELVYHRLTYLFHVGKVNDPAALGIEGAGEMDFHLERVAVQIGTAVAGGSGDPARAARADAGAEGGAVGRNRRDHPGPLAVDDRGRLSHPEGAVLLGLVLLVAAGGGECPGGLRRGGAQRPLDDLGQRIPRAALPRSGCSGGDWDNWKIDFSPWEANSPSPGDPLFSDPVSNDFSLSTHLSPAFNNGVNTGITVDYTGVAVPSHSLYDIGASEYLNNNLILDTITDWEGDSISGITLYIFAFDLSPDSLQVLEASAVSNTTSTDGSFGMDVGDTDDKMILFMYYGNYKGQNKISGGYVKSSQ